MREKIFLLIYLWFYDLLKTYIYYYLFPCDIFKTKYHWLSFRTYFFFVLNTNSAEKILVSLSIFIFLPVFHPRFIHIFIHKCRTDGILAVLDHTLYGQQKPVWCWWHSLWGAAQQTGNLRDMGGCLIRLWWGEQSQTKSDWFIIWICASTAIQSWQFLSFCSFDSSLTPHAHVRYSFECVCVWLLSWWETGKYVPFGEPWRSASEAATPDKWTKPVRSEPDRTGQMFLSVLPHHDTRVVTFGDEVGLSAHAANDHGTLTTVWTGSQRRSGEVEEDSQTVEQRFTAV